VEGEKRNSTKVAKEGDNIVEKLKRLFVYLLSCLIVELWIWLKTPSPALPRRRREIGNTIYRRRVEWFVCKYKYI
jgi:hypothetical protein